MPIDLPRSLPFAVDMWTPASSLKRHRFLTHAHRDHLVGISTTATAADPASIYATRVTILITLRYHPQLDPAAFVELEAGEPPLRVPDPDGDFTVTAFDANHCPGAVMFLFEGAFGSILHTGDCRLTPDCLHAILPHPSRRIDYVYLDCTFARCPLSFPSKEDSIRQVINCIWRHPNAPVVYLVCDMLGQEDVLVEVSRTFGAKIHVDRDKAPDCHANLSLVAPDILTDDAASRFHVMAFPRLTERATEVLALARAGQQPEPLIIRPSSQWYAFYEAPEAALHRRPVLTEPMRDEFGVWHVCLSMHSSREELERALDMIRPRWVVSTTPPLMAIDLSYVKKHCSLSRFGPDDPIWKLLGIADAMSSTVVPSSSSVLTVQANSIEKSDQTVTCSGAEFSGSDDGSPPPPQVIEVAAEPALVERFGISVEPPVTLFGIARFGLLQSESQMWKQYEYQSVEVFDDVETEAMDSAAESGLSTETDGTPDKSVQVIEITEVAANVQSSTTEADELQKHRKSDGQVIDLPKDERMLPSELCKAKDDKCMEVVKGNGEAEPEAAAQQHDSSVHSHLGEICRSRVTTEQREDKPKSVEEISAAHITVSSKTSKDAAAEDRSTTPSEIGKKFDPDSERASDTTSTAIGSSNGLNANLRRLYRSMNVPVPRPLPSLVELMAASKRPRVSQTVQL